MNTERLEQRLRKFAEAPNEPNWEDVIRRASLTRPRTVRRGVSRGRLALVVAACIVIAVAAAVFGAFSGTSGERGAGGPSGDSARFFTDFGADPFTPDGEQVTYAQVLADAPYIPLPHSSLANPGNVGTVWAAQEQRVWPPGPTEGLAVAIYYPSSGVELQVTPGRLNFAGTAADEQQTIDGIPALVLEGGKSYASKLSQVQIPVAPDQLLRLEGFVPASELVAVAKTLAPTPGSTQWPS